MIRRSYLICTTPRSGSNFLCEALRGTGVAGRPDEYFWNRAFWLEGWGVSDGADFVARMLLEGTGPNGVFGSKLTWQQVPEATALIDQRLPNLHYVWLRRLDKVRQGISFYRALETKRWRSTDTSALGEPEFDFAAIQRLVQLSGWEDEAWSDYFEQRAVAPLELTYEELAQAPHAAVGQILIFLGIAEPRRTELEEQWRHQRQADSLTEDWVVRYQAEARQ